MKIYEYLAVFLLVMAPICVALTVVVLVTAWRYRR